MNRCLVCLSGCEPVVWLDHSRCSVGLPLHMHAAVFATGFVDDAVRNTVPSVSEPLLQLVSAMFRFLCNVRL